MVSCTGLGRGWGGPAAGAFSFGATAAVAATVCAVAAAAGTAAPAAASVADVTTTGGLGSVVGLCLLVFVVLAVLHLDFVCICRSGVGGSFIPVTNFGATIRWPARQRRGSIAFQRGGGAGILLYRFSRTEKMGFVVSDGDATAQHSTAGDYVAVSAGRRPRRVTCSGR